MFITLRHFALPRRGGALVLAAACFAAGLTAGALFAPLEIPLGVLLAFIGVPAFLYLYLRGSGRAYA